MKFDGTMVAVFAFVVSLIGLILNAKRDTRASASDLAMIKASLEAIRAGTDEMRVEIRTLRDRTNAYAERVTQVEASAKSGHKRLDDFSKTLESLTQRVNALEADHLHE